MLKKLSVDEALNRAKSYISIGETVEARKLYRVILNSFPNNKLALKGLRGLNQHERYNNTYNPSKELVDQLINLYNQGQLSSVVIKAEALIKQYPKAFVIWNIMGVANIGLKKVEQAFKNFKKVIKLNPNYALAHNNIGNILRDQGKFDDAITSFKKAIFLKFDYAEAHNNMGLALYDKGSIEESIMAYNKALSFKSDYAEAHYNLGIVLHRQGKLDQAIISYKKSLLLKPNYADAYYNLGLALQDQGKLNDAVLAYNKSISLNPNYVKAHKNLGLTLLNIGKVREGLDEYEWRWKTDELLPQQRYFQKPLWSKKNSIHNKRVLIWSEQGIGDTLNWSSCLSLVSAYAEHCILECQEKLVPLLKRSFPNIEVKPEDRSLDSKRNDFDFHLPMGSLYGHFIQEILENTKPNEYILPDPDRVNFWKARLNLLGKGPYIGISWKSANMSHRRLPNYCSLSEFSPILEIPDITLINLQYIDFENDLRKIKNELGVSVYNFNELDHLNNIDDVAALTAALDLVVSIKNTIPFISTAVGTKTKLLNWRQSPWNSIIHTPVGPYLDILERDTEDSWENLFNKTANDIIKLKEINKL